MASLSTNISTDNEAYIALFVNSHQTTHQWGWRDAEVM